MRYLVTGGAGFIGSHLPDGLVARGDSVLALDDLSTGRRENVEHLLKSGSYELVEGSMLDSSVVEECLDAVDACFHLASAVGVQLIVREPVKTLLTNVRGADLVISAAARSHKRLLFTSTSEIYGKNSDGPLHENSNRVLGSPLRTRWAYSTAKAFGEALANGYFREHGAETVVVRLFNTVGPRQTGAYGMVLPRLVDQALADEDLTVYGTGEQSRCFTHVADVVHALLLLVDSEPATGGVFNVGSSNEVAIRDLASKVIERTGSRCDPLCSVRRGVRGRVRGARAPSARHDSASGTHGLAANRTLDEMIDDVVAHTVNARTRAPLAGNSVPASGG